MTSTRSARRSLMTIGDLARRTGVPVKVLRRHEDLGLIYTVGRSALGLAEADIQHLADLHTAGRPVGAELAEILDRVRARTAARIRELEQLRSRVDSFQRRHRATLNGHSDGSPWSDHDPD